MKWKNRNVVFCIKIGVFLFSFFLLLYVFDSVWNGLIKNLFYRFFTTSYYEPAFGMDVPIYINWPFFKVVIEILFFLVLLFFLFFWLFQKRFLKRRYQDKIKELSNQLDLTSGERVILDDDYKELENKINEGKLILQKNRQKALEAEEKKNDLLVYLAHDLKTPLTSVIGYLSFLEEAHDLPEKQRMKYTKIALEKSYRLEELINELFEVARFNSEKIILEKSNINLSFLLEQMKDDFYPILKEHKKKIKIVKTRQDVFLIADGNKLARVFHNILKNAIHYGAKNTVILISLELLETEICVSFRNEGIPIPKEKLEHIFEKFYRADIARSSQSGNAGLGLAIAKEIVLLHGGEICVTSDVDGTIFSVKLPR